VLSACQYLLRSDCPDDYAAIQGDDPQTVLIRGGSCIIDPLGEVLGPPVFNVESIQYADLDRRLIAKGKFDLDVVGHYARPDVFNLIVDTSAKSPVLFASSDTARGALRETTRPAQGPRPEHAP
jgi:nitrilase